MNSGIFISYRREDTRHVAGRLASDLIDRFGEAAVFRDVDSIGAGLDFTAQLAEALSHCAVMLVLIGPEWLPALKRRLDQPQDWVREEIAGALQRGIRVVPVLVENATLPAEADLPPDLKPLVKRQTRSLSDDRWRGDAIVLMDTLAKLLGVESKAPTAPPQVAAPIAPAPKAGLPRNAVFAAVALLVLGGGGYVLFEAGSSGAGTSAEVQLGQADAAVAAADVATLAAGIAGNWRAGDGWTYTINQPGANGAVTIQHQGEDAGKGTTYLSGQEIKMTLHTRSGSNTRSDECDLSLSEDLQSMSGTCTQIGTDTSGKAYEGYTYALKR